MVSEDFVYDNCEHTPSNIIGLCHQCRQAKLLSEQIELLREIKRLLEARAHAHRD